MPTFTDRNVVQPPPGEMLARSAWSAESLPAAVAEARGAGARSGSLSFVGWDAQD